MTLPILYGRNRFSYASPFWFWRGCFWLVCAFLQDSRYYLFNTVWNKEYKDRIKTISAKNNISSEKSVIYLHNAHLSTFHTDYYQLQSFLCFNVTFKWIYEGTQKHGQNLTILLTGIAYRIINGLYLLTRYWSFMSVSEVNVNLDITETQEVLIDILRFSKRYSVKNLQNGFLCIDVNNILCEMASSYYTAMNQKWTVR